MSHAAPSHKNRGRTKASSGIFKGGGNPLTYGQEAASQGPALSLRHA
jgi:hypothetical protein